MFYFLSLSIKHEISWFLITGASTRASMGKFSFRISAAYAVVNEPQFKPGYRISEQSHRNFSGTLTSLQGISQADFHFCFLMISGMSNRSLLFWSKIILSIFEHWLWSCFGNLSVQIVHACLWKHVVGVAFFLFI